MKYVKVESSQIAEVGYGEGLYGPETLALRFPPTKKQKAAGEPGSEYHYGGVTPIIHTAFLEAKDNPDYQNSIGVFFGKVIKPFPEKYPFTKVEADPTAPTAEPPSAKNSAPAVGNDDTPSPGSALALIDGMEDDLLFTPGKVTDAQLATMRSDWLAEAKKYDISTDKARTELKRFARPLQKLRTGIEARAKELTGATKRKIAAIDTEKRRLVQIVGGIEEEVLSPLTRWEQEEETRKARLAGIVTDLAGRAQQYYADLPSLLATISELEAFDLSTMQEFKVSAESAIAASLKVLKPELERRKKAEADQAELDRLRAAEAARAQQEAIDNAARAARLDAERAQKQAEERAELAEKMRLAGEQDAARRAEEAAAQAKRDQEQAVENERMRAAVEVKREREAAEARAANKAHRLKIDNEALGAIVALDIPMDRAQDLLIAITKGLIPHVNITY